MAVAAFVCFDPAMQCERVEDFEDARLDVYRNLKDSTLAGARGRFIVEGRGPLFVLLSRSRYQPESILLSERAFGSMESELTLHKPECAIYVAGQSTMDRIVGFPIHRGCLAACLRGEAADPMALAREALEREAAPRLIVLEHLTNLDNAGLIFRNAMAFGARAVLLCSRSCDPLYRKAIRTSMGGSLCVPFARAKNLTGLLGDLRSLGYDVMAFDPGHDSVAMRSLPRTRPRPTALVFGTEGDGLSDSALANADRRVRIDMEPGVDSLNVGVAAGIGLSFLRDASNELSE